MVLKNLKKIRDGEYIAYDTLTYEETLFILLTDPSPKIYIRLITKKEEKKNEES